MPPPFCSVAAQLCQGWAPRGPSPPAQCQQGRRASPGLRGERLGTRRRRGVPEVGLGGESKCFPSVGKVTKPNGKRGKNRDVRHTSPLFSVESSWWFPAWWGACCDPFPWHQPTPHTVTSTSLSPMACNARNIFPKLGAAARPSLVPSTHKERHQMAFPPTPRNFPAVPSCVPEMGGKGRGKQLSLAWEAAGLGLAAAFTRGGRRGSICMPVRWLPAGAVRYAGVSGNCLKAL